MAVERNPFDKQGSREGLSVELEFTNPEQLNSNVVSMIKDLEDGGVIVEFEQSESEEADSELSREQLEDESEEKFYRNLVDELPEEDLTTIAQEVINGFEADKQSRAEWESMFERGFDLLGLKLEETSEPFEGACTAVHPIIIESAVKFQSKAIQEIFPPAGPVRTQILGNLTDEKLEQAERIKTFMNYQLTDLMPEYFDETERSLFHLPIIGSAIKKLYFDPVMNRTVSEFVPIDQFYISFYATDLRSADRYTHVIYRSPIQLKKDIASGFYVDMDLPKPSSNVEDSVLRDKMHTILGLHPSISHDPQYVLLEQHCYLELPEKLAPDKNGTALPYIVTVEQISGKVLSIRRNYDIADKRREKKIFFTHYRFVPGFGFYGLGYIHFLGNLTMTATAAMRALVDAGQFANLPGGFKAKGTRIVGDNNPIAPGEWKEVESIGSDLSKMIVPLPYKEPSQTLYLMLEFITKTAQKFADSTEQIVADSANYGPVGTTMALLEASSKFFSAIHKRIHKAQKEEFKLLARLNNENLPEESEYDVPNGTIVIRRSDFDGRIDILPVSDPNIPSNAHRLMMAQMALDLATKSPPGMYDLEALHRTLLTTANVPNLDKILPKKPSPVPLDPISDIAATVKGLPIRSFNGQNHDAHIQAKMAFLQDPMNGANPLMQRIVPILQANMQEHMLMKFQEQVNGVATQLIQQYGQQAMQQGVDIKDPRVLEYVMAEAAKQVVQANANMAAGQQAQTPEGQMVALEAERVKIEDKKVEAQLAKESVDAAMKNRELDLKEAKLKVEMLKEGIKTSSNAQEKEKDRNNQKAIAALDAIMSLLENEQTNNNQKALKAADMFTDIIKESNKTNVMGANIKPDKSGNK